MVLRSDTRLWVQGAIDWYHGRANAQLFNVIPGASSASGGAGTKDTVGTAVYARAIDEEKAALTHSTLDTACFAVQ
jgi:hypothetical protein